MSGVTGNPESEDSRNVVPTTELEAAMAPLAAALKADAAAEVEAGAVEVEMWDYHEHYRGSGGVAWGTPAEMCCGGETEEGEVERWKDLCWVLPSGAIVTTDGLANVCPGCHRHVFRRGRKSTTYEPDPEGGWFLRNSEDPTQRYRKVTQRSVRADMVYCSAACRQRAYRKRVAR